MIKRHELEILHNGEYAAVRTSEFVTPQYCRDLAQDLYEDGFYSESRWYDGRANSNKKAFWDNGGSVGEYTYGIDDPKELFARILKGSKLIYTKNPFICYEMYAQ